MIKGTMLTIDDFKNNTVKLITNYNDVTINSVKIWERKKFLGFIPYWSIMKSLDTEIDSWYKVSLNCSPKKP